MWWHISVLESGLCTFGGAGPDAVEGVTRTPEGVTVAVIWASVDATEADLRRLAREECRGLATAF